jgi:hypothetical protein
MLRHSSEMNNLKFWYVTPRHCLEAVLFPVSLTEGSQFDMLIGPEHMAPDCGLNHKLMTNENNWMYSGELGEILHL